MRVHNSKVRLLQHTPVHIPSSTCTSFRFSPLNSFFVMHFSFTQARLRSGVRQVRARSPPYLYRCGNTNQPYTYTSSHHVYTAYIFDICVRLLWRERLCVSSRTWPLGACALLSTRRVARWQEVEQPRTHSRFSTVGR